MATRKNKDTAQEIATLEKKLEQLKKKKRDEDKANRNHRLLSIGGEVEMYLGELSESEIVKLGQFIFDQEQRGQFVTSALGRTKRTDEELKEWISDITERQKKAKERKEQIRKKKEEKKAKEAQNESNVAVSDS